MWEYYKSLYYISYRDTRLQFLMAYVTTSVVGGLWSAMTYFFVSMVLGINFSDLGNLNPATMSVTLGSVYVTLAIMLVSSISSLFIVTWPMIATTIRRLHDMNLVGWYILLPFTLALLVPFFRGVIRGQALMGDKSSLRVPDEKIESLIYLSVMGIFYAILILKRGTVGTNKYGADEKELNRYFKERRADVKMKNKMGK